MSEASTNLADMLTSLPRLMTTALRGTKFSKRETPIT